jgi:hypothetical protein
LAIFWVGPTFAIALLVLHLLLSSPSKSGPVANPTTASELIRLRWRSVMVRVLPGDAGLAHCLLKELAADATDMVRRLAASSHDDTIAEACFVARTALIGVDRLLAGDGEVARVREARGALHRCLLRFQADVATNLPLGSRDSIRAARGVTGSAALLLAAGQADPTDWAWILDVARLELAHYARPNDRFPSHAPLREPLSIMHGEIERWATAEERNEELGMFLSESLLAILEYG